jgi:glycosyl hydrolase family 26
MFSVGGAAARPLPSSSTLLTGVASSAADFASWNQAFHGRLKLRMVFQPWAFNTDPATVLNGPGIPVISWEPWKPPPAGTSAKRQGASQPAYSNAAIAAGRWDGYIRQWAQAIKAYGHPVILRPAAEFNGFWYPWSHDPRAYVRAWRHMWTVFHDVGARNVTWVWSFQVNCDAEPVAWQKQIRQYWPGRRYVDTLGMSLLRFQQGAPVAFYMDHLTIAHQLFGRPTMITESNVAYGIRLPWLTSVRDALAALPFNRGFVWSQAPSQEQTRNPGAGNMNWNARTDRAAAAILAEIAALNP